MVIHVHTNTCISPWIIFVEDASLQHLDRETFFIIIFTPFALISNTPSTNISLIR